MDLEVHTGEQGAAVENGRLRRARNGFTLVKWYLDSVEPDGTASIAYWVSLAWLGVEIVAHDISRYVVGAAVTEESSVRAVPPPRCADGQVAWRSPRLDAETSHDATTPPVTVTLLDGPDGRITWECIAPSARARFSRGGTSRWGAGYAERITMTLPPWDLRIDELRWGRWMSDDLTVSLVWIDWRGPAPRRWVALNGVLQDATTVSDTVIAVPGGRLDIGMPRTLHERAVGSALRAIPGLQRVASRIPLAWDERKQSSRARWSAGNGPSAEGWTIHEIVRFT